MSRMLTLLTAVKLDLLIHPTSYQPWTILTHPVDSFTCEIERQPVRPLHIITNDGFAMSSIHSSSLDARALTPIAPVHPTVEWVKCDSSRNLQVVLNQNLAHVAVEVHYLDGVASGVGEVDVIVDPVDGEAIGCHGLVLKHHNLLGALVNRRSRQDN